VSSLWTPDGERPVRRQPSPAPSAPSNPPAAGAFLGPDDGEEFDDLSEDELRQVTEELLSVPAGAVVANHCIGLFQLAALHLSQRPPNMAEAKLAIDALTGVVEAVAEQLGPDGTTLREALSSIQMAYVQVQQGG
jgi:hypothetical protein